jgi:hypothetical protein
VENVPGLQPAFRLFALMGFGRLAAQPQAKQKS